MHYCLRADNGAEMWGRMVYREIVKPERLVWINSFSDPDGGVTRHPGHQSWPLELHSTALFEALYAGHEKSGRCCYRDRSRHADGPFVEYEPSAPDPPRPGS